MVPVCYSKDDDVSTIGGTFPAYKTMSYHHKHPGYNRQKRDEEQEDDDKERQLWELEFDEKSPGGCLNNRTDLELFLICVIVAALLTLIVLMAMVLRQG